jgi:competence protein ComGC
MKKILSSQRGVTLIEIMAAFVVLTVIIISFMGFFTNAFKYNSMTSDQLQGVNVMRAVKSELRSSSFIKKFIGRIQSNSVVLSKDDVIYDGLGLLGDVERTYKEEEPYYLLKLDQEPYYIHIFIREDEDYKDDEISLFRMYLQVYNHSKMLSDTFTYIEYASPE